jgi:diguanylate cyclase (GGDEF)-like protein/putative nucleotidyltransferase with HDIG domain
MKRIGVLRHISLRWKILIPFIALSLTTWFVAADILGRSTAQSIRDHARSQTREVAESAARQLGLRVAHARSEASTLGSEATLMVGRSSLRAALKQVAPNMGALFTNAGLFGSGEKDLVKAVVAGGDRPLVDLRRSLLEPKKLDDAAILAAASRAPSAAGVVGVSGLQKAYVVGASTVQLNRSKLVTFMIGDAIDEGMLSTNALPPGYGLFVVDHSGTLAGTGTPSQSSAWDHVLQSTTEGDVRVDGVDYYLTSLPVDALGPAGLRMVAAMPTRPMLAAASEGRHRAWVVLGIGGLAFAAMAMWLTTLLTRPLRQLTCTANKLAAGELDARAVVKTHDEIGALGTAFNAMSQQLQKRDQNLREALDKLTRLSETDALTGLYNHRALHRQLERELSRAQRHRLPLSIAVVDIDDFKMINDTYGHPTGDHVIRLVAEVLTGNSRREDIVGRHGGDEFMLLLPGTSSVDAVTVIEKLRAAMHEAPLVTGDGLRIPIRLSAGTATCPEDGSMLHELVAQADSHLYESKRKGGDVVTRRIDSTPLETLAGGGFGMLDSLVTAVDNKDRYTRRHSEDVTEFAVLIAEHLGLSDDQRRILRAAGLLHDVGKIGVPDALLRKPALLSMSEHEIVRHHATLGALVIQGVPDEAEVRRAVATHHERWDGTGYPAGLSGTDIPLLGRILAVADSFSAMTSDRPYRKALTFDEAFVELLAGSGSQFDPDIVETFLAALSVEEAIRLPR